MNICDCRYEPILGPNYEWVGGNIIYCPRHAAVDELYDALRNADYAVWYMANHGIDGDMIDWEKRFDQLTNALALADGDGEE